MLRKINQNGRSMVEMLGVLAIVGILSVGAISGYANAMNKYKANKFNLQISQIVSNVRTVFHKEIDFSGLTPSLIKQLNIAPDDMYKTANSDSLTHVYGGELYLGTAFKEIISPGLGRPINEQIGNIFYISVNGINKNICKSILSSNWGDNESSGLVAMGVQYSGNSPVPLTAPDDVATAYFAKHNDKNYPLPFTLSRAEIACNPTDSSLSHVTIFWYFRL